MANSYNLSDSERLFTIFIQVNASISPLFILYRQKREAMRAGEKLESINITKKTHPEFLLSGSRSGI